jgi:Carboxypeptidase regulatory-like domain
MRNIFIICLLIFSKTVFSQTLKGNIVDLDTKTPINLVSVKIERDNTTNTALSDSLGFFKFEDIKIGRYDLIISHLNYKNSTIKGVLVNSGKHTDLQISLIPKVTTLDEVFVKFQKEDENVSTHQVSIEQTNRYAATWADPARMVMSFAGVNSVNDQSNELVIRGNSPKGLLWMIEGIEVPSPNHFSSEGASGGLVSALNTVTLRNSTFYTGAFPANYGNATSGVFDVRLRNGNNEKRESSFGLSLLGIDAGTEGPISKKNRSSYLINYRFANTQLIKKMGLVNVLRVATPKFQDITFKVNLPFKKSNLSFWGIGGTNIADYTLQSFLEINNRANFFATGTNLFVQVNPKITWETILSYAGNENINNNRSLSVTQIESKTSELSYSFLRLSSNVTKKINGSSSLQLGTIISHLSYKLFGSFDFTFINLNINANSKDLDENGSTQSVQNYLLWKKRWQNTSVSAGVHSSYFVLNNKSSIEPRVNLQHQLNQKFQVNIGTGLHSRLEPISVYLFKNNLLLNGKTVDNKLLGFNKAFHTVLGVTMTPNNQWRVNSEVYYQKIFGIGIGDTTKIQGVAHISLINQLNAVNLYPLIPKGKGENYGWEFTVERSLNHGFYFLYTSSIYKSTYQLLDTDKKPSRFDNGFVFNLLAGKEWQIGKSLFNVNVKNTWAGGIRVYPLNIVNNNPVYDNSKGYSSHLPNFYRLDLKFNYTLNFKKTTSTLSIDINNITNRANPLTQIYNPITKKIEIINQLGLLPVLNYRVNF